MALRYNSTKTITKATLDAASLAATGAVRSDYRGLAFKKEGTNEFLWVIERSYPYVYCFKNGVRDTTKEISNGILNSARTPPGNYATNAVQPDAISYITNNSKNYILINDNGNTRTWVYEIGDSSVSFSGDLGNPWWNPFSASRLTFTIGAGLTTKGNYFYSVFKSDRLNQSIIDYYKIGFQSRRLNTNYFVYNNPVAGGDDLGFVLTTGNYTGLTTDGTYFYVLDQTNKKLFVIKTPIQM